MQHWIDNIELTSISEGMATTRDDTDDDAEENLLSSDGATYTNAFSGMEGSDSSGEVHINGDIITETGVTAGPSATNEIFVKRPALNVTQRSINYHYDPGTNPGICERIRNSAANSCRCSGSCVKKSITARLPILQWLPEYSLKDSLLGDAIAGVTVAIMHIPQGMAYALLGGLPPITGIYMAFFPVFIYFLFGTSRHCSMGTFAVVCLMTGKVVGDLSNSDHEEVPALAPPNNHTDSLIYDVPVTYSPNQVAAIVSLMVGVWEILLGILQLGCLSVFLSDMLVSGFTTGAAVHVLTSQVKYLFGIKVPRYNGPLKIIYTYKDIIAQLLESNPATMVVSGVTIAVLALNNELLKPLLRKKTKIPIPIELIAVVLGTVASYFGHLHDNYNMQIVGKIPTGLPEPTPPPFGLLPRVAVDSFVIAIVSYTVSYSMAKIFAKKLKYDVDATQELYSQGASNIFGSFFGCAPIAASLSRSLIQEAVGGVTQITSLISCVILLFVLLFIGPVFENLPNCVLSSIIVVALKGMFLQFSDLKKIWVTSRMDASIWIVSFLGVVIIDIDYGLMLGVAVSLLVLLARSQRPSTVILGRVPNTDLYLDVKKYSAALEIPSVCIFQFNGPLHFANCEYFRQHLFDMSGLVPGVIAATRALREKSSSVATLNSNCNEDLKEINGITSSGDTITEKQTNGVARLIKSKLSTLRQKQVSLTIPDTHILVLEMSGVSYVDSTGGKVLAQLYKEYKEAGITMCLASVSETVLDALDKSGTVKVITPERIFHSINDAVIMFMHDTSICNTKL
ncbi:hypothetical protein SK128_021036 [Halocaridina rubra]|uniref:STAS domain-containing protein n=1 Tax=Halocaridina rubra TaxID=373956 RepID=A0AAN8XHK9_HALRR